MHLARPIIRYLYSGRIVQRALFGSASSNAKLSLSYTCKVCGSKQVTLITNINIMKIEMKNTVWKRG
ncbi:unnamed protein product [Gongylonema pulchrum]|uniref:DNL-type domain-containing protein n=1 Tax=Gongylonema pulchrum TaxID=637853 RepID=A0A183DFI8_9BILA|nr:unnamed protein product [Gongylonema pulchrum]